MIKKYTLRGVFFVIVEKISSKRCYIMPYFIMTILLLVLLLVLICFTKLNIVVEYNRQGINDHFVLSFYIWNKRIKYKYEIPKLDAGKKGILFRKIKKRGKKEKDVSDKKNKTAYGDIIDKFENFRNIQSKYSNVIRRINRYLKCRLQIKKLDINMSIGLDNASRTAILIGLCWTAMGLLISYLHNKLNLKEKSISIKPDYVGKKFKVDLFCILSVRIGHIIVVGLILLIDIVKKTIRNKFGFIEERKSVAG
jgi:hypothetical protein